MKGGEVIISTLLLVLGILGVGVLSKHQKSLTPLRKTGRRASQKVSWGKEPESGGWARAKSATW